MYGYFKQFGAHTSLILATEPSGTMATPWQAAQWAQSLAWMRLGCYVGCPYGDNFCHIEGHFAKTALVTAAHARLIKSCTKVTWYGAHGDATAGASTT